MANKSTCSEASVEVPKAECMVPGGREGELAVRGNDDIRDKMIVATKDAFWVAIRILVTGELPHDDCLVYANKNVFKCKDIGCRDQRYLAKR